MMELYMKNYKSIMVNGVWADEMTVTANISYSDDLAKYFKNNEFSIEYDKDISNLDASILSIPAISIILPVAWAIGSDIYVDSIDDSFLKSIDVMKLNFKKQLPEFSCSSDIIADHIITNRYVTDGNALLFSAGVDSLSSYLSIKESRPDLITIWGSDIPIDKDEYWHRFKDKILQFASDEGLKAHFIKSNIRQVIDESVLMDEFSLHSWWGEVSHGICLLGLCAPLTINQRISTLFISSSGKGIISGLNVLNEGASHWGNVKCKVIGKDLSRQEKIKNISKSKQYLKYLKVCWQSNIHYNCGVCEKCSRTLMGLILEGVDPFMCDFIINEKTPDYIKQNLIEGNVFFEDNTRIFWQDIQKYASASISDVEPLYRDLAIWFMKCDLSVLFSQELERALAVRDEMAKQASNRVAGLESELYRMQSSIPWMLTIAFHNCFIEIAFPSNTRRRRCYDRMLEKVRNLIL